MCGDGGSVVPGLPGLSEFPQRPGNSIPTKRRSINAGEERTIMSTKSDSGISRRRFLISTSMAATVGLLAPRDLFTQDDGLVQTARKTAAAATITVQKLRGNVSVLMGAGGNIAVLPGRDGKRLIDAGFAGARPKIADALASISSDPIKHLIDTHWHFDHTDGNEWVHSAGAVILAHANTRKHLSTTTRVEGWNFTFPPSPPEQFLRKSLKMSELCSSTGRLLPSSTTPPPTPTATSPFILQRPIFSTSLTPSGTATIPSSIIQRAAASTG